MRYWSVINNCCLTTSGYIGTGSATMPNNNVGTNTFSLSIDVKSDGSNTNGKIIEIGGFNVQITDGSHIQINLGGSGSNWLIPAHLAAKIVYTYLTLIVVRKGTLLKDWSVYLDGYELQYATGGSGDMSAIAPLAGTIYFKPSFLGAIRNINFHYEDLSDYDANTINPETVVAGWSLLSTAGLFDENATLTSTDYAYDGCSPKSNDYIDRIPFLPNAPIVVPAPYPIIGSRLTGYTSDCHPVTIETSIEAQNYSEIQFKFLKTTGYVRIRATCSNEFSEDELYIPFSNDPAAFVTAFNGYDTNHWVISYDSTRKVYTLRHYGGSAPDLSSQACGGCNVPHVPYIYNLLIDNPLQPFTPTYPAASACSACDTDYTCYLSIAVYNLCAEVVKPYACFNDRVFRLRIPDGVNAIAIGNDSYQFPFIFVNNLKNVINLRWRNNNQLDRFMNIEGQLIDPQYESESEVSKSAFGITRKIFSQTFKKWKIQTQYYSYNLLTQLNEALTADHLAIQINGRWVPMVMEGSLELKMEQSPIPRRAQAEITLTEQKFTITNNF